MLGEWGSLRSFPAGTVKIPAVFSGTWAERGSGAGSSGQLELAGPAQVAGAPRGGEHPPQAGDLTRQDVALVVAGRDLRDLDLVDMQLRAQCVAAAFRRVGSGVAGTVCALRVVDCCGC